jgi:hypothetical protein
MRRRPKREERGESGLPSAYEGPDALAVLLGQAGCSLTVEEVSEQFRQALAGGAERSDAIPALFEAEPRFSSPEDARRLYRNLFGLWDCLEAGAIEPGGEAPEAAPEPPGAVELPERGASEGSELAPDLVEAVWKHLAALPERELRRTRDRFEGAQPELAAWVEAAPLPESGVAAAHDLAFEAWVMFDVAFGDRLRAARFHDVRALAAEPPPLESTQPALAAYVQEALDLVAEEDPTFAPADRAQVERTLATIAAALTEAVEEEEESEDAEREN